MRSWKFLVVIAMIIGFIGCGRNRNRQGQFINSFGSPLSTACLQSGVGGVGGFSPYNTVGGLNGFNGGFNGLNCSGYNSGLFYNYPMAGAFGNGFVNGFGGCGIGATAVYGASLGLGCFPQADLLALGIDPVLYGWDPVSAAFFHSSASIGTIGAFGAVGSCVVGTASCGIGFCVPVSGAIGICSY